MKHIVLENIPYYMGEACDCCRGYWYNRYFLKVDGEYIRYDPHPEFPEIETDAMNWSEINGAKAYIFDEFCVKGIPFTFELNDQELPDDDE